MHMSQRKYSAGFTVLA